MGKRGISSDLSSGGGGGGPGGAEARGVPGGESPPAGAKRPSDSAKKCGSLKSELGPLPPLQTKLKVEPGESPVGCGLGEGEARRLAIADGEARRLAMAEGEVRRLAMGEAEVRRLAMGDEEARRLGMVDGEDMSMSPGKEGMLPLQHQYNDKYGKEDLHGQIINHMSSPMNLDQSHHRLDSGLPLPGHHRLEPVLSNHNITDPTNTCHNFSVDSLMTSREAGGLINSRDGSGLMAPRDGSGLMATREGSPTQDGRSSLPDMGYSRSWGNISPGHGGHYPSPCLYPTSQTSLEELSSMTAACLPPPSHSYSRPSWYSMPGGHSPSSIIPDQQTFSQSRDYFDSVPGKAPSPGPGPCQQVPYRSPPYRTPYYEAQDCAKY